MCQVVRHSWHRSGVWRLMRAYQSIVELVNTKFELQSLQTLVSESGSNCLTKSGDCACALGIRGLFWVLTVTHDCDPQARAPPQCQDNSLQFTTIHHALKMSLNRGLLNLRKLCLLLTSQLQQRFPKLCDPYLKMTN